MGRCVDPYVCEFLKSELSTKSTSETRIELTSKCWALRYPRMGQYGDPYVGEFLKSELSTKSTSETRIELISENAYVLIVGHRTFVCCCCVLRYPHMGQYVDPYVGICDF